jgi:hypothetical protein
VVKKYPPSLFSDIRALVSILFYSKKALSGKGTKRHQKAPIKNIKPSKNIKKNNNARIRDYSI